MAKRIKMFLYANPGTGKSVFASKFPKPFFICTDGNYEWLTDFGADPNAHKDCHTYSEIKTAIEADYSEYETIVLDLAEDAFKWCEQEFCERNRIEHVSDIGGYSKGYTITRNDYFIAISKLLALDKNVIILSHGKTFVEKDRRGVEHTKHSPTDKIPEKVMDSIEGRVRYCLRAYVKDEEHEDGTVTKRRMLSLVPKPNEYGIIRGVDENGIPQDIDLDVDEFLKAVGLTRADICGGTLKPVAEVPKTRKSTPKQETKVAIEEAPKVEETPIVELATTIESKNAEAEMEASASVAESAKPMSNEDKIAAIKAKLAKLK